MQKYTIIREIGRGAYGAVSQAVETSTQKIVAIKQIFQKGTMGDASKMVELQYFQKIGKHPNVVTLYELFRERDGSLYFVFEYIDSGSLYDYLVKCQKLNKPPAEAETRSLVYNVLLGLAHIHGNGFIHRDMKLENILLHQDHGHGVKMQHIHNPVVPKIADLGCAKSMRTRYLCNTPYTGTRWYRSIELLLRDKTYGEPNDVWAVGCIAFEMHTLRPLFQGNSELDMMHMIMQQFGPLQDQEWPEYTSLAASINFVSAVPISTQRYVAGQSHTRIVAKLATLLRGASTDMIDCIAQMLELNPGRRTTAVHLLNHPWFKNEAGAAPPLPRAVKTDNPLFQQAYDLMKKPAAYSVNDKQKGIVPQKPIRSSSNAVNVKKTVDVIKDNSAFDEFDLDKLPGNDDW